MFITESKLKKIIYEEYLRLTEGDVVQGRFGGASRDGGIKGSGEAISFADRSQKILGKKREEKFKKTKEEFNKQVVEFNKNIGEIWGRINKKYNDMCRSMEKKRSVPGEVTSISPDALKREKLRLIGEKRSEMIKALEAEKDKAHKLDSSIVPHVGALLRDIKGTDSIGKVDGLERQTRADLKLGMDKFLEGWYTAQGVRYPPPEEKRSKNFYITALDYFHYYEALMTTLQKDTKFISGRRHPGLFPPKEPTSEPSAKEVPTKKPSHLRVVKQ